MFMQDVFEKEQNGYQSEMQTDRAVLSFRFLFSCMMFWLFNGLFANNEHYNYNSTYNSDLCATAIICKDFFLSFSKL